MRRSFRLILGFVFLFAASFVAIGQSTQQMRFEDKIRVREAMRIARLYGEKIWVGMAKIPFAIILVTDSVEFLLNHPSPSQDFNNLGFDTVLSSNVYQRKTVFNKRLLATFPAVNGINTIVVGTPENTGRHSTDWIITLLHEHFHQYTYSSPNYYADAEKLGLSGGDQSGMWMLNYPFPYRDSYVILRYNAYVAALSKTLSYITKDAFGDLLSEYIRERRAFQQLLKPADYRYFSFQVWQEGIARYAEYKFLEMLEDYEPFKEVAALPDFVSFKKYRESFFQEHVTRIAGRKLEDGQRECFYALGLGEGLILDKLNPAWRGKYLTERFFIERYAQEFHSPAAK